MSSVQSEVYAAFRFIGVDEDPAMKAAAALGQRDNDLAKLDTRLAALMVMVGGLYAIIVPVAWLLLRMAFKGGALS